MTLWSVPPAPQVPPAPEDDDRFEELEHVVDVLAEATALLQAGGRELRRIAAMCRQAQWALRRAVDQVRAAPPPPESLTEWRHDLRARVGTIAGWTRFFDRQRDDATRIRTLEIIERNAKLLADLVAHPPV